MGGSKGPKCSIKSCPNRRGEKNLRFFRFPNPKEVNRVQLWKKACNDDKISAKDPQELYANFRVCSSHFDEPSTQYVCNETF